MRLNPYLVARMLKNLSKKKLCKLSGVTIPTIMSVETGQRTITPSKLHALARVLKTKEADQLALIEDFLNWENEKNENGNGGKQDESPLVG